MPFDRKNYVCFRVAQLEIGSLYKKLKKYSIDNRYIELYRL